MDCSAAADILNSQLRLDAVYYITRVLIPPLERIFNLVGADIRQWYDEMPKTIIPELVSPRKPKAAPPPTNADADETNIGGHFMSTQCLSCGEPASQSIEIGYTKINIFLTSVSIGICESCCFSTQDTIANLNFRIRTKEERVMNTHRVCASCAGSAPSEPIHCESIDCQWFYARRKAEAGLELVPLLTELSEEMEEIDASIDEDGEGEETVTDVFDLEYQSPYSSEDDMYASS
jgi:DNA polymerase zeta